MNAVAQKFLFVTAAGVTIWALMQSPSAQTTGADAALSAMEEAARKAGVSPKSSAAARNNADAAMARASSSLPTQADRKASAAMSR
jgi:hypothetical protein